MEEYPSVAVRVVDLLLMEFSHLNKISLFTKHHGAPCVVYLAKLLPIVFLSLRYIDFEGTFASFSFPHVEKLTIECCYFNDLRPLQHLIDAVISGRVKHTLVLSGIACYCYDEQKHYELLLQAVGKSSIQKLDIVGAVDEDDHEWLSLALIFKALKDNTTLKNLVLGD